MIKCMYQYYSLGNADGTILISDLDQKDFIALLLMIVEVFTCLVFLNSTFFKKLKYSWFTIFTYTAKWVSYTHTCIYIYVCVSIHTHTHTHTHTEASLVAQMVKHLLAMGETCIWSLGWDDPLEEGMATHSSVLAGESSKNPHGQRSLADYSPRCHKQLDMTEKLSTGYRQILLLLLLLLSHFSRVRLCATP